MHDFSLNDEQKKKRKMKKQRELLKLFFGRLWNKWAEKLIRLWINELHAPVQPIVAYETFSQSALIDIKFGLIMTMNGKMCNLRENRCDFVFSISSIYPEFQGKSHRSVGKQVAIVQSLYIRPLHSDIVDDKSVDYIV